MAGLIDFSGATHQPDFLSGLKMLGGSLDDYAARERQYAMDIMAKKKYDLEMSEKQRAIDEDLAIAKVLKEADAAGGTEDERYGRVWTGLRGSGIGATKLATTLKDVAELSKLSPQQIQTQRAESAQKVLTDTMKTIGDFKKRGKPIAMALKGSIIYNLQKGTGLDATKAEEAFNQMYESIGVNEEGDTEFKDATGKVVGRLISRDNGQGGVWHHYAEVKEPPAKPAMGIPVKGQLETEKYVGYPVFEGPDGAEKAAKYNKYVQDTPGVDVETAATAAAQMGASKFVKLNENAPPSLIFDNRQTYAGSDPTGNPIMVPRQGPAIKYERTPEGKVVKVPVVGGGESGTILPKSETPALSAEGAPGVPAKEKILDYKTESTAAKSAGGVRSMTTKAALDQFDADAKTLVTLSGQVNDSLVVKGIPIIGKSVSVKEAEIAVRKEFGETAAAKYFSKALAIAEALGNALSGSGGATSDFKLRLAQDLIRYGYSEEALQGVLDVHGSSLTAKSSSMRNFGKTVRTPTKLAPKAGFAIQRNKRTGEERYVPL